VKRLNILWIAIFFIACSNRTGIPNDIIPPDSMTRIMKDVVMANEYSMVYIPKDSLRKNKVLANQELLDGIFKMHHITKDEFKNSLHFYESRPDLNQKIFDSLSVFANRHKTELYLPKVPIRPGQGVAK
jgi:Domain of unknown function (DUF4296)